MPLRFYGIESSAKFIAQEPASVTLENLSVEEGVKRILKGKGYTLSYAGDSQNNSDVISPKVMEIRLLTDGISERVEQLDPSLAW